MCTLTKFTVIMLIPNCTSGKDVYILATDKPNRGSEMVGPTKPGVTHLSQVRSPGPSVMLDVYINSYKLIHC